MRRIGWIVLAVLAVFCLSACSSKKSGSSDDGGGGAVTANFTASPTSGDAALEVTFTSTSTGTITSYSWDFGDGGTSTQANPTHTYTSDGTYTVILTVVGSDGSDSEIKTAYITVGSGAGPTVDFEGTPLSGEAALTVDFTDLSTGNNVHAWSWNFGDGGTSSEQHPSHIYSSAGIYDVTLSATDDDGTNAKTRYAYITVTGGGPPPNGEWETLSSGYPGAHFYGIHFADANNGWCVGTPNILLRTTDGGITWTNQYDNIAHDKKRSWLHGAGTHVVGNGSPHPEFTFLDVHAVSANAAWVTTLGGSTCAPGYSVTPAFVTTNGGAEWIPVMTSSNFEDWAIWAFDADTANICSIGFDHHHDSDIHSISGGYEVSRTNCYMMGLYDISFSGSAGWFVGKKILYTADGGSLAEQNIPSGHLAYLGVDAISASTAWAVGVGTGSYSGKGVIGYTTDAGATWNDGGSVNVSHLYEIDFSDANNGYFVGAQGLICNTTDGGQNWTVMDSGTANLITDIHALDSGHVWACGWSNTILRLK
jgi:PKD repeat protein